jgi:hypothetical protein
MASSVKTLREFLLGNFADFVGATALHGLATAENLASLVIALAHYKEEGRDLAPEFFLCQSIEELAKLLPGSERHYIGQSPASDEAVALALKKCAPLAREGWSIFVEPINGVFRFGVFRDSLNPISISIHRTLFAEPVPHLRMVRLHRLGNGCVSITNQHADTVKLMLSEKPSSNWSDPNEALLKFVAASCRGVQERSRDVVKSYLERTLAMALGDSHGTLLAVSNSEKVPKFLGDAVVLEPPIDIAARVIDRVEHSKDENYGLHGINSLLHGMVNSDGIVLFSRSGKLLAYNCFVRVPTSGATASGGARSRAFAALSKKLGRGVAAVFSRSQDGWIKYEEIVHAE